MTYSPGQVETDYLSLTYPPGVISSRMIDDYIYHLYDIGGESKSSFDQKKKVYTVGRGRSSIVETNKYLKIDLTGELLVILRSHGIYMDILSLLGSEAHKVTRLDVAHDVDTDYPVIRKSLEKKFPGMIVPGFSRKVLKATEFVNAREDGQKTGTYYIGQRGKTRYHARIYDKMHQMSERHGDILPTRTRYELELGRQVPVTLRDAANPEPIFWHFMSPTILEKPPGVPDWEPSEFETWKLDQDGKSYYEKMHTMVANAPIFDDLLRLVETADNRKNARAALESIIAKRLAKATTPSC